MAFAGFGHRYSTLEVYSTSAVCEPWSKRSRRKSVRKIKSVYYYYSRYFFSITCYSAQIKKLRDLERRMDNGDLEKRYNKLEVQRYFFPAPAKALAKWLACLSPLVVCNLFFPDLFYIFFRFGTAF